MKDNEKYDFAHSINSLSGMPPMLECMNFGMTWGCRPDCPVFKRGECKEQEENHKFFEENNMY